MAGRFDQKKTGPGAAQDQEQEQDVTQEQNQEQEREKNHQQNTMGNQAIAAMLNARSDPAGAEDDGGGSGQSVRARKAHEKEGQDYGGDDVIDDVPITLEDLSQSWKPSIKKSEDRPRFVEPMPDDDLPPEDPEWLEAVFQAPYAGPLPRIKNIDALLQPSASIVARSMAGWCKAASRWETPDLSWRSLSATIAHNAPVLQSPGARVLPARAAIGALASCLLAESPAVRRRPTIETGAIIEFCLELEGRSHRVDNLLNELESQRSNLPRARDLLASRLPNQHGELSAVDVHPDDLTALERALNTLVFWEPLESTVPVLEEPTLPDTTDEDPLGLDEILNANTGGPLDQVSPLYQAALRTAERFASAASITRMRWIAAAALVAEVAQLWTGCPSSPLLRQAQALDAQIDDVLKLLLQVARAAKRQEFEPSKIQIGLTRTARMLDLVRKSSIGELASTCAALLPGQARLQLLPELRADPLSEALDMGQPTESLTWLECLPPDLDRDAAMLFIQTVGGVPFDTLRHRAEQLRRRSLQERAPGPLSTALTIVLAHAHFRLEDFEACRSLADDLYAVGRARRNGLLVAEGALLSMESLVAEERVAQAEELRLKAGRLCLDLGARGALSLLARWRPAQEEPEDFTPFFDYPMDFEDDDEPDAGE
ncbi:MAG: hypothetical protein EA397_03210 [Deltaproteobacteria bacterium]|nr:MAG: hypothetical protein EA397_03210 [Deltaproteobacteria bacterium]